MAQETMAQKEKKKSGIQRVCKTGDTYTFSAG